MPMGILFFSARGLDVTLLNNTSQAKRIFILQASGIIYRFNWRQLIKEYYILLYYVAIGIVHI